MKRLIFIAVAVLVSLPAVARRHKTGPAKLTRQLDADSAEQLYDTIRPAHIRCSGYDKPNSATRETFFVTNLDSVDIAGVGLEFEYFDTNDRQLHRAAHSVMTEIPAGETRVVSVPSWDRNNSFHYYLSQSPARRRSTPYKVKSRVDYVLRRR